MLKVKRKTTAISAASMAAMSPQFHDDLTVCSTVAIVNANMLVVGSVLKDQLAIV